VLHDLAESDVAVVHRRRGEPFARELVDRERVVSPASFAVSTFSANLITDQDFGGFTVVGAPTDTAGAASFCSSDRGNGSLLEQST
jgi:hypothetical protein